jgi:hypothetical protein
MERKSHGLTSGVKVAILSADGRADLGKFVAQMARTPFVWGSTDCIMCVASWVALVHGVDYAADLRGTYHDEAGCLAVLKAGGGLPVIVARRMRAAGIGRTADPRPGDIAVVRTCGVHVGAIRIDGQWIVKGSRGVYGLRDLQSAAAWRI